MFILGHFEGIHSKTRASEAILGYMWRAIRTFDDTKPSADIDRCPQGWKVDLHQHAYSDRIAMKSTPGACLPGYASHFGIANIPFGIASSPLHPQPQCVSRFEDNVIFLADIQSLVDGLCSTVVFSQPTLNDFAALPRKIHQEVRRRIQQLLAQDPSQLPVNALEHISAVQMALPVRSGDFTDFSCSADHVLNASEAMTGSRSHPPSFYHQPVGYAGRCSSLDISGSAQERPLGQFWAGKPGNSEIVFGPSRCMDYELEVGALVGKPLGRRERLLAKDAAEHIFGFVLVNDWSARDIQGFEMSPLGPLNGKNLGTSVSPWVIMPDALIPFNTAAMPRKAGVPVRAYLDGGQPRIIQLQVHIALTSEEATETVCRSNTAYMYWSLEQCMAQQALAGCGLQTGDLIATGTVSGPDEEEHGCLMEYMKAGTTPPRGYLDDGETIVLDGYCGEGVGFGECFHPNRRHYDHRLRRTLKALRRHTEPCLPKGCIRVPFAKGPMSAQIILYAIKKLTTTNVHTSVRCVAKGSTEYAAAAEFENAPAINNNDFSGDAGIDCMTFESTFPEFFEQVMIPLESGSSTFDNVVRPPDVSNFTQDFSFNASEFDFSLLEDPAAWTETQLQHPLNKQTTTSAEVSRSMAESRSEALKRSPWSWNHWVPPSGVGAFAEHNELNVDEDRVNAANRLTTPRSGQVSYCSLEQSNRDQMIRIITKCTALSMPSFPTLQLLEDLINVCLLEDSHAIDSHIHIPTLDTQNTRTELLLAMVARGAAFISFPPIWKMGMMLQDVVRYAIGEEFEKDNSVTRELQAVQVSLMWVTTGVWSGFRRTVEISASFLQPPVTMLGWSNAFSRSQYSDILPTPEDSSEVLDQKWLAWSEQEARKRLVFHTFLHDSQVMLVHMRPPLISPAQMHLPIPASRDLWLASNAHAWRSAFLAETPAEGKTMPSTINIFSDPELLSRLERPTDKSLCYMLIVHSMAHEVFEYRQQAQMLQHAGKRRQRDKGLSHMSKLRDLYDDLTTLLTSVETDSSSPTEISFVLEFLMMLLHVSLDDTQVFAGRSGEDEARKVYPQVRTWTQDAESRRAIRHAGQVFQYAKKFEKTRLRDFYAVALYHSTLVLWVWGMVTSGISRQSGVSESSKAQARVLLDGPESRSTKAFVQLGHGTPGLEVTPNPPNDTSAIPRTNDNVEGFYSLSNSRCVMATAAAVLRGNFPHPKGGLPPLVGNLASLLDDLGTLPT
ncbi:unnamed protein product [Zymoseptoria tritici ST99CH_3D1]|nr:unnamed protein product [Zymoseptoria tritici ST99CH_3D1]